MFVNLISDYFLNNNPRMSRMSNGGDIYDALAFGARLSNRAGVGKVMIAVTCDIITSGWSYGDSLTMLKEGMIALHYINPNKLALKMSGKKLKTNIFGFDKKSVYTLKNLRSPEGDTSYRNQLRIPKVGLSFLHALNFIL